MNDFKKLKFHISGSADKKVSIELLTLTHKFIKKLVNTILDLNGDFVITFGDEQKKNNLPLIFDYTIMEAIEDYYSRNISKDNPITKALLYNFYEKKMPSDRRELYNSFKNYDYLRIKKLSPLRSQGGKLRQEISKSSDILIILGGAGGVFDLIDKFNEKNKIIIPLNIYLGKPSTHDCINRLNDGSLSLYPSKISNKIISKINTFCLETDSDIQDSIRNIIDLIKQLLEEKDDEIISLLITDLKSLQEKNRAIKCDEDKYSIILVEFLRRSLKRLGYFAHTQEISGKTQKGYDDQVVRGGMGELDIRIVDQNNELKHICEAFVLNYLDSSYIIDHLTKIFDYDANGLKQNIMIIYSKSDDFSSLWAGYLDFLHDFDWKYPLVDSDIEDLSESRLCPAEIKLTLTKHNREGVICKLYHIFVNLK